MIRQAKKTEKITIYVIDDDASVRRSLARLLKTYDYQVETYESALVFLQCEPCRDKGCIILDVNMPELDGMALHEKLIQRGHDLPIIFLTAHGDIPMSVSAIKKGASDFLIKPVDEEILFTTIAKAIASFEKSYDKRLSEKIVQARLATLTKREREVLQHVIAGLQNKVIAAQLGISEKTVKVHRARVMEKMGVTSVAELVRSCIESRFVPEALERH